MCLPYVATQATNSGLFATYFKTFIYYLLKIIA